jgi:phenylpropionate dioxygenase-like ring-hydroxylating dioxygenase large terminal subunit
MNVHQRVPGGVEQVRDDYVPASDYTSQAFADLENELLWPRVWQMACREEDVPKVGDYYTYDIVDDSIIVIRTKPDEIEAFHNACAHRGRRLTSGCGHTARFHCKFHGWQFDLDGKPAVIVDRDDWTTLNDDEVSLIPVKTGRWGGWVYINMDPNSESLEDALGDAPAVLDPFDFAGMRYHWRRSTIVPCNWKVALEAFNEAYHLQQTHRQMLPYFDDYTTTRAHGRHSMVSYWEALPFGYPSKRLGPPDPNIDLRAALLHFMEDISTQINGTTTITLVEPARRVMREVAPGATAEEVFTKLEQFTKEGAEAQGITYPTITAEQQYLAGVDWHLFPNHIVLPGTMACFVYRARPNGHDPDSAIWDVISLLRYPPGKEPKPEQEWAQDHANEDYWGKILVQDFANFGDVQRGMKSRGFRGARTSPKQEIPVSNFHRALREFMGV